MKKEENDILMEKIISLSKRRGFIYQGSEIYGGLAGTWDYGPLGVTLKNNIMYRRDVFMRNQIWNGDPCTEPDDDFDDEMDRFDENNEDDD